MSDCNTDTLNVLKSKADKSLRVAKVFDKFQFERNGFFSVDPDTTEGKVFVLLNYVDCVCNGFVLVDFQPDCGT